MLVISERDHKRTFEDARRAALDDVTIENPFPVGGLFRQDWEDGFAQGLSERPPRKVGGKVGGTKWVRSAQPRKK